KVREPDGDLFHRRKPWCESQEFGAYKTACLRSEGGCTAFQPTNRSQENTVIPIVGRKFFPSARNVIFAATKRITNVTCNIDPASHAATKLIFFRLKVTAKISAAKIIQQLGVVCCEKSKKHVAS